MSTAAMDAARDSMGAEQRRTGLAATPQRRLQDFFQFTNLVLAFSYEGPSGLPSLHQYKCRIGKYHAPVLMLPPGTVSQGFLPFRAPLNRYHHFCWPRCAAECKRVVIQDENAITEAVA